MKTILVLILLLTSSFGNAQDFAPIGATWHYKKLFFYPQPYLEHYTKLEVVGDTLIDGKTCSKIEKEYPLFCNDRPDEEYVYVENDTVFYYDTTFAEFQILADFNATQGDSWEIRVKAYFETGEDTVIVNVDSTDFVTINGQSLKRLHVNYVYVNDGAPTPIDNSSIIERIGDTRYMFAFSSYGGNVICDGDWSLGLRCYEDSILGFYDTGISDSCEYFEIYNNLNEYGISTFTLAPNPAEEIITITVDVGILEQVQLLDAQGRLILSSKEESINLSNFISGIYFVRVLNNDVWTQQRFIKN